MVKVQVPGVNKDDVQLTITENALTVKGEMKEEEKKEDKNYHRREFRLWGVRTLHRLTCAGAGREGDRTTQGRCPRSHHAEERSG